MVKLLQNRLLKTLLVVLLMTSAGGTGLFAQNISFIDANVKALCVAPATDWDSNGDGELSYTEAAAVTSIGTVFKGKTNIISFNELQYFTSLTTIDEKAFMGCTALAEITIPVNIATIGDKAFVNCPALATVHFNAINCTSMNTIYSGENYSVFMSNQTTFPLTNLIIGSSVQNIPDYAFRGCNQIQELTIPVSVTTVGDYAFYECTNLATLTIGGGAIGEYAFFGCSNLETLTIGEGVTSINNYAFWNCPALLTVHFNAINCTSMGEARDEGEELEPGLWMPQWVFYSVFNAGTNNLYCSSPIATLTIGDNVTRIPDCAFCGCTDLSGSLNIPNSVTSIGAYAFAFCTGFTGNLTLGNSITEIGAGAFMGCSGFIGDLAIPNSVISIHGVDYSFPINNYSPEINHQYHGAFMGCSGFTGNLTIGDSVTRIGYCAFYGCSGFTGSLTVPNSVIYIEDCAFSFCSGFTGSLTIPNSVTYIGYGAFSSCSGFTGNLTLGNSLTGIGTDAFSGCSGFTGNLVIPNSLRSIGYRAFSGCGNFNGELIIGRNVNTISDGAFSRCSGFTAIVLETSAKPGSEPSYNWGPNMLENYSYFSGVFSGMNRNIPVYVPTGQISNYQNDGQGQWSYFTNYVNQVKFEQDDNDQWSDEFNWPAWEVPAPTDVVCITDNCQLDMDADVLYVYMLNDNDVLTVNSGKTLNATYGVHIENASQLVIEDGAQLYNPLSGMQATMQKHINGYGTGDDGWYTIAAPVSDGIPVSELTTGNYDLYVYDEPTAMWFNQKVSSHNITAINPGQGFLYANQAERTLNLAGQLNASNAEISVPVSYTNGATAGFNLVGNPYTNNISITDVKINGTAQSAFYRAEGGSNIVAYVAEDNEPIKPGDGFFVKATEAGTLTFGGAPTRGGSQPEGSYVRLVLHKDGQVTDRAYLRMSQGTPLEKVSINDAHSLLYFMNGGERYAVADNEADNGGMPLYLEKADGTYTIEASLLNAECDYLHLIDHLTGADIDLLATPSYTFTAKADDYAARFDLVFSSICEDAEGDNGTFAFISNGNIIITNADANATLQIMDMTGRVILSGDAINRVSTSGMMPGVYVLRLINGNDVKTQKMVID